MNALLLLIPLSILILVGAAVALFWAVDRGQFDDLETPGLLPILDADVNLPAVASDEESTADPGNALRRPS